MLRNRHFFRIAIGTLHKHVPLSIFGNLLLLIGEPSKLPLPIQLGMILRPTPSFHPHRSWSEIGGKTIFAERIQTKLSSDLHCDSKVMSKRVSKGMTKNWLLTKAKMQYLIRC